MKAKKNKSRLLSIVYTVVLIAGIISPGEIAIAQPSIWNYLSTANINKTDLNAEAYQYPCIGNAGLVLLADPYGFTQYKTAKALYNPNIYYSGWWQKDHYTRVNPFSIEGGYKVSDTLNPGQIKSFSQTLDVTKGRLETTLGLSVNNSAIKSIRSQFVTTNGVLVIKIEDDTKNTFQVKIPQNKNILKYSSINNGISVSTTTIGKGNEGVLSVVGSGANVRIDTINGIVSVEISAGQPAYFYISAGSEIFDGEDFIKKAANKLALASDKGNLTLQNENSQEYNQFWEKSSIDIPDDDIKRKYILSQYILKATQDNNPLPDGCFGPRSEGYAGSIGAECDQMFVWNAMLIANHPNISKVLPDWFQSTLGNAKVLAKTFYPNTKGAKWAWLSGYDGAENQDWGNKNSDWLAYIGAFAANMSILQSQYTNDAERLGKAKTILELAVNYQLDACVKENGLWVNDGMSQGLPKKIRGEITEQASLLWSLNEAVELGVGPSSWAEYAHKIYLPIKYDSVQEKNILVRYKEHEPFLGSKIDGFYLYLYGTPWVTLFLRTFGEYNPLLQPTYQAYIGDKDLTYIFSKGIASANAAIMGYGQEALTMLKAMPVHNDLYYSEWENKPELTIEVGAHGSLMLGIQNMLLDGQSEKIIKIFPALPKEWENTGSGLGFNKLLANGAIEVTGRYSNSEVKVALNNTGKLNVIRTLLVRIPSTFTNVSEAGGIKIDSIVNGRFAKLTVTIPANSVKNIKITGTYGNHWYEEDDSLAIFSRGWMKSNDPRFYSSASHISNIGGSFCEYKFSGTGIRITGTIGPDRGYAKVAIDGVNQGCYNLYAYRTENQKVLFENTNLKPGEHSIKWQVTGKKIFVSNDAYVDIDKIEILTSRNIHSVPWLTSDSGTWKKVPYAAVSPAGGVQISKNGLFKPYMDKTITYLLAHSNVDDMLYRFRLSAGISNPPCKLFGWEKIFPAHAGMFMMGAGNILHWQEEPELRNRLNKLTEGLKECINSNSGLIVPYGIEDCHSYPLTLFTHGLESAGLAGNIDAWQLMAATSKEYRKEIEAGTAANPNFCFRFNQNYFAVSAIMNTYFSPVGIKDDIRVAYKHVHKGWMELLEKRDPRGIYQIPISHPHSAETYGFVGFLDIYRATGDKHMLNAMLGAWELIHANWELPGGNLAICECDEYPPNSLHITPATHTGESCSQAWWIKFNQKLHQLYPLEEKYISTIEKSIYNVILPNQDADGVVCYHAKQESKKDYHQPFLSCCEVLGTYLISSLPEYIYTIANDGLYVNLYESSSINWKNGNQELNLQMTGNFPFKPDIGLRINLKTSVNMKLRVRIPSWAEKDVPVKINGKQIVSGKPGTYVILDRTWTNGDLVEFTLPMNFKVIPYNGADQIPEHKRYSIFFGPIQMAVVGPINTVVLPDWETIILPENKNGDWSNLAKTMKPNHTYGLYLKQDPNKPLKCLVQKPNQLLNFTINGQPEYTLKPYWQVAKNETFNCFPVIETESK